MVGDKRGPTFPPGDWFRKEERSTPWKSTPWGGWGRTRSPTPVRTQGGGRTLKGHWGTPHEGKGATTKASSQNGGMWGDEVDLDGVPVGIEPKDPGRCPGLNKDQSMKLLQECAGRGWKLRKHNRAMKGDDEPRV